MGYFSDMRNEKDTVRQLMIMQGVAILDMKIEAIMARLGIHKHSAPETFENLEKAEGELVELSKALASLYAEPTEDQIRERVSRAADNALSKVSEEIKKAEGGQHGLND